MVHYGYSLTDGTKIWGPTVLTNDFTTDYQLHGSRLGKNRLRQTLLHGLQRHTLLHTTSKPVTLSGLTATAEKATARLADSKHPTGAIQHSSAYIADGKVYLDTTEHSPNSPLYKDAQFRCINATDGTEICTGTRLWKPNVWWSSTSCRRLPNNAQLL